MSLGILTNYTLSLAVQEMEEEVREILHGATKEKAIPDGGLGTEIASLFRKIGLDTDIPELRGHRINPEICLARILGEEPCSLLTSKLKKSTPF